MTNNRKLNIYWVLPKIYKIVQRTKNNNLFNQEYK